MRFRGNWFQLVSSGLSRQQFPYSRAIATERKGLADMKVVNGKAEMVTYRVDKLFIEYPRGILWGRKTQSLQSSAARTSAMESSKLKQPWQLAPALPRIRAASS
jgi:hypothetical protein